MCSKNPLYVHLHINCDKAIINYHKEFNEYLIVFIFSILDADVATATVLISMGAVLGRTTYVQLVVMGFFELVLQAANVYLNEKIFHAADRGDSIFVHTFGAYFGLAVGFILNLRRKYKPDPEEMESSYNSDALAMIGKIFYYLVLLNIITLNDLISSYSNAINVNNECHVIASCLT